MLCHPFLLPPSIFASIGLFQMSQLFASGGPSFGVSVSASVIPVNIQNRFPLGLIGLTSFFGTCNLGASSTGSYFKLQTQSPKLLVSHHLVEAILVCDLGCWMNLHTVLLTTCGSAGKESACNAGDLGLIPGSGRSPGEGKGYPLQYSGLENFTDCISMGSI